MKPVLIILLILFILLLGCESEKRLVNKALTDIEPLRNEYFKDGIWKEAGDTTQYKQTIEQSKLVMILLEDKPSPKSLDYKPAFKAIGKICANDIIPFVLSKGKDKDWVKSLMKDTDKTPVIVFFKNGSITHHIYIGDKEETDINQSIIKRIKEELEQDRT